MMPTLKGGVRLRGTHADGGGGSLMWIRHPVFSRKEFGFFCTTISSLGGIKSEKFSSMPVSNLNY